MFHDRIEVIELPMENILSIILLMLIIVLCSLVALGNLVYRRRKLRKLVPPLETLTSLKEQGIITEEELESLKNETRRPQELPVESCTISAEEMMEAIDAALEAIDELQGDSSYAGDEKWAEAFGIHAALDLSLKELTFLSMKMAKPREAIDLIAEVLAMNMPIDALEAAQKQGETVFPRYEMIARMTWVQTREQLSELISIREGVHEQRKVSDQSLLAELVHEIMKTLHIPTAASGFGVILALMVAKTEFNAFSDENESNP